MPVPSRQSVPSLLQVDSIFLHLNSTPALDEVCRFLGAELHQFVSLAVYRWDGARLVRATSPVDPGGAPETIAPGVGAAGQAASRQQPVVIGELGAAAVEQRFSPEGQSQVGVPILHGERLVGVLAAESRQPRAFDATDARFLTLVGQKLATTLEVPEPGPPAPGA